MMYVRFLTNISHYVISHSAENMCNFCFLSVEVFKISKTTGPKDLFHCINDVCEMYTSIPHLILVKTWQ